MFNPVESYTKFNSKEYNSIYNLTKDDPNALRDKNNCDRYQEKLGKKHSFLLYIENAEVIYVGDKKHYDRSNFISVTYSESTKNNRVVLNNNNDTMMRYMFFELSSGKAAQVYIVTDLKQYIFSRSITLFSIFIIVFLLAIIIGIYQIRNINKNIVTPLNKLMIATKNIEQGDLNIPIELEYKGEIGELCDSFERMRFKLEASTNQRLENEEQTRTVISNIAHDLKTPLTSIKGYTEGLIDGICQTDAQKEKYLKTIYSKSNDMSYLIDELSYYSLMENNELRYSFEFTEVNPFFLSIIEEFKTAELYTDLKINFNSEIEDEKYIYVDKHTLKRAITNIAENSIKYNDKDMCIIDVNLFEIKTDNYKLVRVSITDNGPGVSVNNLNKLFQRFFRADASRNTSKKGTGLGLSIAARIVKAHKGHIYAKCDENEGLTINFTLRLYDDTNETVPSGLNN
ncbi:MAG: HAMP domain-containing histidine kinase [Lachnospiraceae bacterium]|nr:HAMP domain-containing histidine kinase [Lachnospiraceae bacterium]